MIYSAFILFAIAALSVSIRNWYKGLPATPTAPGTGTEQTAPTPPIMSPPPPIIDPQLATNPGSNLVANLGAALTNQYETQTTYGVSVYGDDLAHSLTFDCSSDPHPEDVCFMLYKRYPEASEQKFLSDIGVQKLYFTAGLLKRTWQKLL